VAAAPKKPAAKAAPRKEESQPLSRDEKIKRHGMFAVIGFNLSVILCVIFFVSYRGGLAALGLWDFVITILVALVVAAATFGVTTRMDV
jgi:heme/copper-type cytochrome/quinol oxidase subunit 4